jgi:hypothetical protein
VSRGAVYAVVIALVAVAGTGAAARAVRRRGTRGLVPHPPGSTLVSDGEYIPAFDHDLPAGSAGYSDQP